MTPQQINAMSMWQFYAMLSGATEDSKALSGEEADELWDWLKKKDGAQQKHSAFSPPDART